MAVNYLVAGLGNIGPEYENTRHNMGFIALDAWAKASNVSFSTERYGDTASLQVKGRSFTLLKPSTYMNLSGNAVRYYLNSLSIGPERLIVICDDLNLPFGTLRMRKSGSSGGHNGLENIIECIGTTDFCRIRMGIGNEFAKGRQVDFVLGKLSDEQLSQMELICPKVMQACQDFAFVGADKAMNAVNSFKLSTINASGEEKCK